MFNLGYIINENNKEHNEKWPYIPDHSFRILLIGGSGSGNTNTLFNLIKKQDDVDMIGVYVIDLSEPKHQFLIGKRDNVGIKHLNDPKLFTECSDSMDDAYDDIDEYNLARKKKKLIVFDDMYADIMSNKKLQAVVKELFIRNIKLNISLVFVTQSYFSVPKDVRLDSTHYLIMRTNIKRELQNIAINHF